MDEEKIVFGRFKGATGPSDSQPATGVAETATESQKLFEKLAQDPSISGAVVLSMRPGSDPSKVKYDVKFADLTKSDLVMLSKYLEKVTDGVIFS